MQLTFINGSPRGKGSNTERLMEHFIRGFLETEGNTVRTEHLARHRKDLGALIGVIAASECVILGFPLYMDAMPGLVKELIEAMAPPALAGARPALGVVIQCGFPETVHNRYIERYCEKLARRLELRYLGGILKGGCEGLDIQPAFLTDVYFRVFYAIGVEFGRTGAFDAKLLEKLARPERLTGEQMQQLIPFVNKALWDSQMEANGVLDKSFDRPFQP